MGVGAAATLALSPSSSVGASANSGTKRRFLNVFIFAENITLINATELP